MSETSSVMKIPLAHCSRSKVHKSLINNANSSGLLTSPCLVPILQRKAFVRPLTVRTDAYKLEYKDFTVLKVVRDPCQKITLLLLKSKSVRVIVPESCF